MNQQTWALLNKLPAAVRQKTNSDLIQHHNKLMELPEVKEALRKPLLDPKDSHYEARRDSLYEAIGKDAYYSTLTGQYLMDEDKARSAFKDVYQRGLGKYAGDVVTVFKDGKWQTLRSAYGTETADLLTKQ